MLYIENDVDHIPLPLKLDKNGLDQELDPSSLNIAKNVHLSAWRQLHAGMQNWIVFVQLWQITYNLQGPRFQVLFHIGKCYILKHYHCIFLNGWMGAWGVVYLCSPEHATASFINVNV